MHRIRSEARKVHGEIEAPDVETLHLEGLSLVRNVVGAEDAVGASESRRFPVRGETEAERFYRYLRELVDLWERERFVPAAMHFEGGAVVVEGERVPQGGIEGKRGRLGLTRHRYQFDRKPEGSLRAHLLFDV
jgi:hypothetical protein